MHLTFPEPSLFRFQANEVLLMIMGGERPVLNTSSRKSLARALAACPGFTWCLCEPPRASAPESPETPLVFSFWRKQKIQPEGLGSSLSKPTLAGGCGRPGTSAGRKD